MKHAVLLTIFLVQNLYAFSQQKLTGFVTDATDGKPVPYASIGITRTPDGTISGAGGAFSITLTKGITDNDTLKFSSIGYQSKSFLVGELKNKSQSGPLAVLLYKSVNQLKQVNVVSGRAHVKIEGYDKNSKLFGLGFYASGVGSEAGVIIPVSHTQTNLQNVSFYIIQNPFKHLLFRLNVYEIANNKPGNSLVNENILLHVDDNRTGKITYDLSKYNLYADKDVLITLEWLTADPPTANDRISVAATVFGHTFYRQASQSAWTKRGTGIGVSVKTVY